MTTAASAVYSDENTLVFGGSLTRSNIAALWATIAKKTAGGVRRLDLTAVTRIDSAGLALLSQLATLAGSDLVIDGSPARLTELRAAYRLAPTLLFSH